MAINSFLYISHLVILSDCFPPEFLHIPLSPNYNFNKNDKVHTKLMGYWETAIESHMNT